MSDFELYLVSNGSMNLYPQNSLAAFTNHLSEPLALDGQWSVALADITLPSLVKNVPKTKFMMQSRREKTNAIGEIVYLYSMGDYYQIGGGLYHNIDELLRAISLVAQLRMGWSIDPITQKLSLTFEAGTGLIFPDSTIPDILGFRASRSSGGGITPSGKQDGFYIGHQNYVAKLKDGEKVEWVGDFTIEGDFPIDISGGRHLTFVYLNIIEYQHVGDSKAPLLRFLSTDFKLNKGSIVEKQAQTHYSFKDFQFKPLLSNTVQSIRVELRSEGGDLIPFIARGRTALSLKFRKMS